MIEGFELFILYCVFSLLLLFGNLFKLFFFYIGIVDCLMKIWKIYRYFWFFGNYICNNIGWVIKKKRDGKKLRDCLC